MFFGTGAKRAFLRAAALAALSCPLVLGGCLGTDLADRVENRETAERQVASGGSDEMPAYIEYLNEPAVQDVTGNYLRFLNSARSASLAGEERDRRLVEQLEAMRDHLAETEPGDEMRAAHDQLLAAADAGIEFIELTYTDPGEEVLDREYLAATESFNAFYGEVDKVQEAFKSAGN